MKKRKPQKNGDAPHKKKKRSHKKEELRFLERALFFCIIPSLTVTKREKRQNALFFKASDASFFRRDVWYFFPYFRPLLSFSMVFILLLLMNW